MYNVNVEWQKCEKRRRDKKMYHINMRIETRNHGTNENETNIGDGVNGM